MQCLVLRFKGCFHLITLYHIIVINSTDQIRMLTGQWDELFEIALSVKLCLKSQCNTWHLHRWVARVTKILHFYSSMQCNCSVGLNASPICCPFVVHCKQYNFSVGLHEPPRYCSFTVQCNAIVVLSCSRSWQVIVIRTSDREGPLSPSAATYLWTTKGPAKKTWMCIVSP